MTVVIAIAMLSDWLKRVTTVFQPMRSKTKTNRTICTLDLSRALSELHVIAENCDWFIVLSTPVVIGRSSCLLWFWFFESHLKTALKARRKGNGNECGRAVSLAGRLFLLLCLRQHTNYWEGYVLVN